MRGIITVAASYADTNKESKRLMFNNCAPFTDCISEINKNQVDDVKFDMI